MGDDSKASCLTATSTIVVAIVGASATIIAALITILNKPSTPTAILERPTPVATSTPAPGPKGNRLSPDDDDDETPTPTPSRPRAPRIEGLYTLQGQNVSAPMQAEAEFTKVSDDEYRWRTDYRYFAFPDMPFWSMGALINDGGQWMLSMQSSNEPNTVPYNIPVRINYSNNVLTIAINDNQGMTWRKR